MSVQQEELKGAKKKGQGTILISLQSMYDSNMCFVEVRFLKSWWLLFHKKWVKIVCQNSARTEISNLLLNSFKWWKTESNCYLKTAAKVMACMLLKEKV